MVNREKIDLQSYMGKLRPCVVCNQSEFELWTRLDNYEAKKCKNCEMISINPHLTEEGLSIYYKGYLKDRLNNEKTLFEQRKITYTIDRDWICKLISQGSVLDVGCSGGYFLSTFDQKKWERMGIDVEEEDAKFAKEQFDIDVKVGFLPDMTIDRQFDLVMLRGVIEHISNPVTFLKKCCDLMKPGGLLFITATPAGDAFAFDVYREKWHLFTPPEHLHFFSLKHLTKILEQFNLELFDFHYQYQETPYANVEKDFDTIKNDIFLIKSDQSDKVKNSVPFPGSMITAVWRKQS